MRILSQGEIEAGQRYAAREKARDTKLEVLDENLAGLSEVESPERVAVRVARLQAAGDMFGFERIIGASDLLPISYLERGETAARAVARISIRDGLGRRSGYGTGFMVSPRLIMTNNHVLPSDQYGGSLAEFGFEDGPDGIPKTSTLFKLRPDLFFVTSRELDFTLIAVEEKSIDGKPLADFGFCSLIGPSGKALITEFLTVIQHPNGLPKQVSIRENELVDVFDKFVTYTTDTEPGSSGSPVFNDNWDVVALHHRGVPKTDKDGKLIKEDGTPAADSRDVVWVANEGIRISAICAYLQDLNLTDGQARLRAELLGEAAPTTPVTPAEPPAKPAPDTDDDTEDRIVAPSDRKAKKLMAIWEQWQEKTLPIETYADRKGYDPDFLGDEFTVFMPMIDPDHDGDIVRTKSGEKQLDYHHFSVVMNKSRRVCWFSAVNIDGATWKKIKRGEGEAWYTDPRIEPTEQTKNSNYKHKLIDRGHMTRRMDPDWGPDAEGADLDTFHFTNSAPQHASLNRKIWNDLEDYILKRAVKAGSRVSVFTGPVFGSEDIEFDGVRIPSEFWKVVAYVDDEELRAVAYLQTQKEYLGDLEVAFGEFRTYETSVQHIEKLTGLDFGKLRKVDPKFGQEATEAMRCMMSDRDLDIPGL